MNTKDHPQAVDVNTSGQAPSEATDQKPIGVVFRLNPDDHEVVTEYARNKKMSIQELLEAAVNLLRDSEGLPPIKGRPRSKTRLRR